MDPQVSIIIPVYNAEKFLCECLDSLIIQNFKNWECVLVDDGSKDSSPTICDKYVAKDIRFKVIHKENGGPSRARNAGLDIAQGEWISFIDADDWVDQGFFDEIFEYPDVDVIYFGFKRVYKNVSNEQQIVKETYSRLNDIGVEYSKLFDSKALFFGFTVNKFFKRKLIESNHVRFPENLAHREDEVFAFRCSHYVKSIVISNKVSYNYRIYEQSLSHSPTFIRDYMKLADLMEVELSKTPFPELKESVIRRVAYYRLGAIVENANTQLYNESYTKWLKFSKENRLVLKFSVKQKILLALPQSIGRTLLKIVLNIKP